MTVSYTHLHGKHNLGAMEKLFAGYLKERLDGYLTMLSLDEDEKE